MIKSEKSVRELRLALGRLVNFIQLSSKIQLDFFCFLLKKFYFDLEIEIPTALHIRPVLKAHDITDGKSKL